MTDWSFEETLTAGQTAELLGTSWRTVARMVDRGELVTRINRSGRGRVFSAQQVKHLQATRPQQLTADQVEVRKWHRMVAYSRALQVVKKRHEEEFLEAYTAELAKVGIR